MNNSLKGAFIALKQYQNSQVCVGVCVQVWVCVCVCVQGEGENTGGRERKDKGQEGQKKSENFSVKNLAYVKKLIGIIENSIEIRRFMLNSFVIRTMLSYWVGRWVGGMLINHGYVQLLNCKIVLETNGIFLKQSVAYLANTNYSTIYLLNTGFNHVILIF